MRPKAKPVPTPRVDGEVCGWTFRYTNPKMCNVGNDGSGPYKRFVMDLTRYEDYARDPAAAVLAGLQERKQPRGPSATVDEADLLDTLPDDGMPIEVEPKLEKGLDRSNITTAARDQHSVADRFLESKHSQWSAFESRGKRHTRVWADVEQASAAEPSLKAELDALFKCIRGAARWAGLRQMDSLQAWAAPLKSKQLVPCASW